MRKPRPPKAAPPLVAPANGSAIAVIRSPDGDARLEKTLREGGFDGVQVALSLANAEKLLGLDRSVGANAGFDLIVIHWLPAAEGYSLCRRIKSFFQYQDIPVILVSHDAGAEGMQRAFAYGAIDYLHAPVRDYELLARTRSALRLKYEIDRRKAREKELLEAARQLSDLNGLLESLSVVDTLTGVGNRRYFDNSLGLEWRRSGRNKRPLSLLMLDVDHFKNFNDRYGHPAGDDCLRRVVAAVRDCLHRPGDVLCRYGGEEFAVILPDTPPDGALRVAETIRVAIERAGIPHEASAVSRHVTVSIGVSGLVPDPNADFSAVVAAADRALYAAKAAGRNRVHREDPSPKKLAA